MATYKVAAGNYSAFFADSENAQDPLGLTAADYARTTAKELIAGGLYTAIVVEVDSEWDTEFVPFYHRWTKATGWRTIRPN